MKSIKSHFKNNISTAFLLFVFSSLITGNANAEQGAVRFSNNAFKQLISKTADGKLQYNYVEPGLVLPEDIILYEIVFENISDKDVVNIVVDNPIANNSRYREGSANGDFTEITYSVDNEKFATPDALMIKGETGITRKAEADDYTAIRWLYKKKLTPGEKARLSYKTSIN